MGRELVRFVVRWRVCRIMGYKESCSDTQQICGCTSPYASTSVFLGGLTTVGFTNDCNASSDKGVASSDKITSTIYANPLALDDGCECMARENRAAHRKIMNYLIMSYVRMHWISVVLSKSRILHQPFSYG